MANPSNSMNANESSIDTIILHDKSVKSPQDHIQTTSNLHISITNDTKPVLSANTTSDSVTSSKFADNEDSVNEEQEIKTNDPDKNQSPDIFAEEHQPQLQHDRSADTYNEHEIESNNSDSDRTLTAPDPTSFYRQNSDTYDTYDIFTGTISSVIDDECDYYGQEEEEKSYHPSLDEDHDQIAAVNDNEPSPPPSPGHSKRPTFDYEDDHKLYDEDDEDDQKLVVLDPETLDIAEQNGLDRNCRNIPLFVRIIQFKDSLTKNDASYDEEDEKNPVLTADNLRTHNGSPHSQSPQQRPSAETLHGIVNTNDSATSSSSGSQSPRKSNRSSSRHSSKSQLAAIMEELAKEDIEVDSKYGELREKSVHINWSYSTPTASNAGSVVDTGPVRIIDVAGAQLAVVTMGYLGKLIKFIKIIDAMFKPFLDKESEGNHDIMAIIIGYYPQNEHLKDCPLPGGYKLAENKAGHVRSGSAQSHLSGGPAWNYDEIKKACTNTDGEYVESDTNYTESPVAMKARRSISYEPAAANYVSSRGDEENGLTLEDWEANQGDSDGDWEVDADDEEFSEEEKGDSDDEVVSDMITARGVGHNDQSRASIFICRATGHDSNHDELQNDISMEHEDPPSTTNAAVDEEVNAKSDATMDEHDSGNDMELDLSEMVASGGDAQYESLVEPDAILRHITDVTEEDIEQEEEEEPQEDQPINQPVVDPYFDPSLINFDYNGNLLDAYNEQFIQTTKDDDDYPDNYY